MKTQRSQGEPCPTATLSSHPRSKGRSLCQWPEVEAARSPRQMPTLNKARCLKNRSVSQARHSLRGMSMHRQHIHGHRFGFSRFHELSSRNFRNCHWPLPFLQSSKKWVSKASLTEKSWTWYTFLFPKTYSELFCWHSSLPVASSSVYWE